MALIEPDNGVQFPGKLGGLVRMGWIQCLADSFNQQLQFGAGGGRNVFLQVIGQLAHQPPLGVRGLVDQQAGPARGKNQFFGHRSSGCAWFIVPASAGGFSLDRLKAGLRTTGPALLFVVPHLCGSLPSG